MRKPPFIIRFLLVFVSIALSLCLFVSALAAILVIDLRTAVDADTLQQLVTDAILSPSASHQSGTQLHVLSESTSGGIAGSAKEMCYDFLQECLGGDTAFTQEQFDAFWEASTVKDFMAKEIADVIHDICTGDSTASVSTDELLALVEENKALISEHLNVTVTDEMMQSLRETIDASGITEKLSHEGVQMMLGSSSQSEPVCTGLDSVKYTFNSIKNRQEPHMPTMLEAVRFVISDRTLYTILGVCAAIIVVMILINYFRISMALVFNGVSCICAAVIMLIPSFLSTLFSAFLSGTAKTILDYLFNSTIPAATVTFIIGIVFIFAGVVVRIMKPHKIHP